MWIPKGAALIKGRRLFEVRPLLNQSHYVKRTALDCKVEVSRIIFYEIGHDTFSSKPFHKQISVIFYDLNFEIWYGDENMSHETFGNIANGRKISSFN